jgi:hypothetical protein
VQKQIDAFVGNEPPNEYQVFVAREIRDRSKDPVVVGITDYEGMGADPIGHCLADRDIGDGTKESVFDAIVPTDDAARALQPGLMNNQCRFP